MNLVDLRKELETRGWDCQVMNLNENRRVRSPEYLDVQSGWDYLWKVIRHVRRGYAVHARVNGETKKGYLLALAALLAARLWRRPALLTYAGGHRQTYFPARKLSFRWFAFSLLFRLADRIYCNSDAVRKVLLTSRIRADIVEPIPHFSTHYLNFTPTQLDSEAEEFLLRHDAVFFSYMCFRKEFELAVVAEAIRKFRRHHPGVGYLWVGAPAREIEAIRRFLQEEQISEAVLLRGSLEHDVFLTMLSRSLAYIRPPVTDGVCSSVLESLKLKVPVLASDNGTRPPGSMLWRSGNVEDLVERMEKVLVNHAVIVAELPEVKIENNTQKLVDSIERIVASNGLIADAHAVPLRD